MKLNHYILVNIVAHMRPFINPNREIRRTGTKKQPHFNGCHYENKNIQAPKVGRQQARTREPRSIRSLFRDMDVLSLIYASRHEHHAENNRQHRENDAADHERRSALGGRLELIKAKAGAEETNYR